VTRLRSVLLIPLLALTVGAGAASSALASTLPPIKRSAGVVAPGNHRSIEVEPWHPGRLTVTARRLNGKGRPFGPTQTLARNRAVGQCATRSVRVPSRRERITLLARAFGGAERDTITFG
jgi:hypothetical protein